MKKILFTACIALAILNSPSWAQMDNGSMGNMDHGSMDMGNANAGEAMTMAKINKVDKDNRSVNVDHPEIKALGWPAMTMDLPVTRKVDLDSLEAGQDVMITIKKGRDNQFRITDIGN